MTVPRSPAVVFDRVSKVYGTTRALDRVSLTVPAGQFTAVIGRSGAGKTTLLRCLSRAVTPTEGAILVEDRDIVAFRGRALRRYRARTGMIYQQFNLVRRLTVMDNVLVGRLPHTSGLWRWAGARPLLRAERPGHRRPGPRPCGAAGPRVAAGGHAVRRPAAACRHRAGACPGARADPGDEPVASLDVANGTAVMEALRHRAVGAGLTVIATLHHVEYARRFADRILGLADGRVVFDGAPASLDDAALSRVFGEGAGPMPDGEPLATAQPELAPA